MDEPDHRGFDAWARLLNTTLGSAARFRRLMLLLLVLLLFTMAVLWLLGPASLFTPALSRLVRH